MVAMTQESLNKYSGMLVDGATLLTDDEIDTSAVGGNVKIYKAPIFSTVATLARPMVANILVLGILNTIAGIASPENLQAAIQARVPAATIELNIEALTKGISIGKRLIG